MAHKNTNHHALEIGSVEQPVKEEDEPRVRVKVPDEVGGSQKDHIHHDEVIFVRSSVKVVDGIFENISKVVDSEDACDYLKD